MKAAILFLICFMTAGVLAQNNDYHTTSNKSEVSSKHAVGVDFHPFLYNLKFQNKRQEGPAYDDATPHEFKSWNFYYEYALSQDDDRRINNKLKIGLLGFYNREENKYLAEEDLISEVGYVIQHAILGLSVGILREHYLSDFWGFYGGVDAVYLANTIFRHSWTDRFYNQNPEGEKPYIYHFKSTLITHKFSITPQIGFSCKFFDRMTARIGVLFDFSYSYLNDKKADFREYHDGSIQPVHPTFTHPKKLSFNAYPQITLSYAL